MIVKFVNGDTFLEIDTESLDDEADVFEKNDKDFEKDTLEIPLEQIRGEYNE